MLFITQYLLSTITIIIIIFKLSNPYCNYLFMEMYPRLIIFMRFTNLKVIGLSLRHSNIIFLFVFTHSDVLMIDPNLFFTKSYLNF